MEKQYRFMIDAIADGCTVLIYDWPVQRKTHHVSSMDRVTLEGNILHIDGKPVIGKTIAIKPKTWRK